jgi:hypothetical protein
MRAISVFFILLSGVILHPSSLLAAPTNSPAASRYTVMVGPDWAIVAPTNPAAFRAANDIPSSNDLSQIETDLGVVSGRVTQVETDLGVVSGRVDQVETDLGVVSGRVTQVETDLGVVSGRVTQVETDLGVVSGRVDQAETDLGAISNEVDQLQLDLPALSNEVNNATWFSNKTVAIWADFPAWHDVGSPSTYSNSIYGACQAGWQGEGYLTTIAEHYVTPSTNAATAGSNLAATYALAEASAPTASDRAVVICSPGVYEMSATLAWDTEYVDLVSLTSERDVFLTGSNVQFTADHIRISGIDVTGTDEGFLYMGDAKTNQVWRNVKGGDWPFDWWDGKEFAGEMYDSEVGDYFGLDGTVSGTVSDNTIGDYFGDCGTVSGTVSDNTIGDNFGWSGTVSGTVSDNTIGGRFGMLGAISGTVSDNTIGDGFGKHGTVTGTSLRNTFTGSYTAPTGAGVYIDCIDSSGRVFSAGATWIFNGTTVSNIQTTLTDSDSALPTGGAVSDALAAATNALGDLALEDWPASDGQEYVAKNGAWAVSTGGTGGDWWTNQPTSALGFPTNSWSADKFLTSPDGTNLVWSASSATATNVALADLTDTMTDTYIPVGDGADLILKSPADVRGILDLEPGTDVQTYDAQLDEWATIGTNALATYSETNHTHSGVYQPASANLDEWTTIGTNTFAGYSETNHDHSGVYQPADAELTEWAGVSTNVLASSLTTLSSASSPVTWTCAATNALATLTVTQAVTFVLSPQEIGCYNLRLRGTNTVTWQSPILMDANFTQGDTNVVSFMVFDTATNDVWEATGICFDE